MRTVFAALAILFGAALASSVASRSMFFPTSQQAPCGSYRKTPAASYSASISPLEMQNRPAGSPPRQRENHLAAQSKMPLQAVLSGLLAVVAVRSRCVSTARRVGHATAASAAERQERIVSLCTLANRRSVLLGGALASSFLSVWAAPPARTLAAVPEPAKQLTEAEMELRLARKAELLKKQSRREATDAKVVYNGAYQAGKRESKKPGGATGGAGVAGFLLPGDVGGVNLQSPFQGGGSK